MEKEAIFSSTDWILAVWKYFSSKSKILKQIINEQPELNILVKPLFYKAINYKELKLRQQFTFVALLLLIFIDIIFIFGSIFNVYLTSYGLLISFFFIIIIGFSQNFFMPSIDKFKKELNETKNMGEIYKKIKNILEKPLLLINLSQSAMLISIISIITEYALLNRFLLKLTAITKIILTSVVPLLFLVLYFIILYIDYRRTLDEYLDTILNNCLRIGIKIKATIFISNLSIPLKGEIINSGKKLKFKSKSYLKHEIKWDSISYLLLNK